MPVYINMAALGATSFASNALGALDSVAHPLEPGNYAGEAFHRDVRVGTFDIEVAEEGSGEQIEVDLCEVAKDRRPATYRGGGGKDHPLYAVFHCDQGKQGLYVILRSARDRKTVFDSRSLNEGDYYIVTPVRPGSWSMGSGKSAKGMLIVEPAQPGKGPRASAMGVMIKADGNCFAPAEARVRAGDGVAFEIIGKNVVINLDLSGAESPFKKGRKKIGLRLSGPLVGSSSSPGSARAA